MTEGQLIFLLYLFAIGRVILHVKPDIMPGSGDRQVFKEIADAVMFAGLAALCLITFGVRSFYIPSASMVPTLEVRDFLIANRLIYHMSQPVRGDVVVFRSVTDPNTDMIKRVIGVGGDVIEIARGQVFRNGMALDEPYAAEPIHGDMAPVRVPEGHIYMMGDNRNNSHDSRFWGPLPLKNVVGKAWFVFMPWNRRKQL